MMNRKKRGAEGESIAVDFLKEKGYRILQRNFRFERGEIDIIAEEESILVFIEVKSRRTMTYGAPEDAVTLNKRRQIRRIAEGYLFMHNIDGRECRFDVITIQDMGSSREIQHFENAF